MNPLEQKIWDLVHKWCDQQSGDIPDQSRRALMDSIMEALPVQWLNYPEWRPNEYGKYLVQRKDGKIHWEVWNSTGWAYNNYVIVKWLKIKIK